MSGHRGASRSDSGRVAVLSAANGSSMSPYRYCESHDALLDAVHDEILAAHPPRPVTRKQSWREVTTEMARALRRTLQRAEAFWPLGNGCADRCGRRHRYWHCHAAAAAWAAR